MSIDKLERRAVYRLYGQLERLEARKVLGLEALLLSNVENNRYVKVGEGKLHKGTV